MKSHADVIDRLLASDEPSIRWKVRTRVLGEDPRSDSIRDLQLQIRDSERIGSLLSGVDSSGRLARVGDVYAKWLGAHWVLASLADLGYPPGDMALEPLREQVLDRWLAPTYYTEFETSSASGASRGSGVPVMRGRHRSHASMQGNALYYLTRLGLADERCAQLAELLLRWQWPDGGWNCDRNPGADTSSFMETLLPMCGLAVHADRTGDTAARNSANRAAEVFLQRRLFKRQHDSKTIRQDFLRLRYPRYWYYDILGGLRGMVTTRKIGDPRCIDALDLLESKRLPDGGWPAEIALYTNSPKAQSRADYVNWGGTSKLRMNAWITADALEVLRAARRLLN